MRRHKTVVCDWPRAECEQSLLVYRYELDEALKSINIPAWCYDVNISSAYGDSVTKYIDGYYNAVVQSIHSASAKALAEHSSQTTRSTLFLGGMSM